MSLKIKKGDNVIIEKGKDKGKTGKILKFLDGNRIIVEGANIAKKHMRRRSETETGGIKEIPSPFSLSNVALFCPSCAKGVRFGVKILEGNEKVRVCKKCQQTI
jgi:large subunit ribosomal protein L24